MVTINKNFPLDPNGHSESKLITALYLYGDKVTVDQNGNVIIPQDKELLDSSLIRPELNVPAGATDTTQLNIDIIEAQVDAVNYMTSGPGRLANGYQFDLVKAFFGENSVKMSSDNGRDNYQFDSNKLSELGTLAYDNQGNLIGKKYTKADIDQIYFQNQLQGYSATLELRNYDDGTDNLAQRIYVWNSQEFSMPDNVEFIIRSNGTKEIRNFRIEPNTRPDLASKENFDFATANPIVEIGSRLFLEPRVDPSRIGRTVYFEFENRPNLPLYNPIANGGSPGTYDINDFNSDLNKDL